MSRMVRRVLRQAEVLAMLGVGRTTIWRWEKEGKFPKRIKLGTNSIGWFEDDVVAWQDAKQAA